MLNNEILRHHLVSRRTFILGCGKVGIFSALLARMLYLQLLKGNEYQILSDKNRISLIILLPERGSIIDRNNIAIAENRPSFCLKLDRRQTKTFKNSLESLFTLLALDEDSQRNVYNKLKKSSKKIPINLIDDVSWEQVALVEESIQNLPGIYIEGNTLRKYNFDEICCHITGYVGKISETEQTELSQTNNDFQVGKTGIEKEYEEILQGKIGYRKIEIDAYGLYVNQLDKAESIRGDALKLNLDMNLQQYVHSIMEPKGSSAVVMDVNNGEIIAASSMPAFNPNEFIGGISSSYWKSLINDPFKPLINKIIQTQYPPGSPFKLITILAALEAGVQPSQTYFCEGHMSIGTKIFNCWYKQGHGSIDMLNALKHSCNCYMFNVGKLIGSEKILEVAKRFGFGHLSGIDLPGEQKGFVPNQEWKIRNFKFGWSLGDAFNISIGQGPLLSTPLQLARMVAAFANEGKLLQPKIAKSDDIKFTHIEVNPEHLNLIKEGMFKVVNEAGGTAYGYKPTNVLLAGKTGTAQVQAKKNANDDLSRETIQWERRNHALFTGFAPFENPKYAISVIVDHGGGGAKAAAPIAQKICNFLFKL